MMHRKTELLLLVPCVMILAATVGTAWADDDNVADLIYHPATGGVWVNADESGGTIVSSFQFETTSGTLIPGNYINLTGGTFGMPTLYEDVTEYVIGDTDLTFAGFGGTRYFGDIFPTGMNQTQLDAYLDKAAVYTGALGTEQQNIELHAVALPGDVNLDGKINSIDYVALKTHMGGLVPDDQTNGDFDWDSDVDWYDYNFMQGAFSDLAGAAAVPEPGTMALLAFGALAAIRRRRR